ncbi:MAG: hypothetical protein ABI440_12830 [Casimicrobiaceae bacterium]
MVTFPNSFRRLPLVAALLLATATAAAPPPPALQPSSIISDNAMGMAVTISTTGAIDLTNPFFQSLGSNGRTCASCHQPSEGWTVTPMRLQQRFDASGGTDPIFRTNDGAHSPLADVSTLEARRNAYNMLLSKGLIRVGMPIPAGAEFELVAVDDPYAYANASDLSLFRRPLPSTNLKFLNTVMWDGRETFKDSTSADCLHAPSLTCFATLHTNLADQANGATLGHAQGAVALTASQQDAIVAFESSLYTAQFYDDEAGYLGARGGGGGPQRLVDQAYWFGINDVVSGDYRTGAQFNPNAMTLYTPWASPRLRRPTLDQLQPNLKQASPDNAGVVDGVGAARRSIARGEALFNSKLITITGVKGLNDDLDMPVLAGTCTTCHDAPNAGNHSIPAPLDIGVADASRRTPDMPLYTLRNRTTLETVQTTDPGRALVTGKWVDIGRFKGPTLRAVATRAPYFHNGSARDLVDVVQFYNTRFGISLTAGEQDDLVAFLLAL